MRGDPGATICKAEDLSVYSKGLGMDCIDIVARAWLALIDGLGLHLAAALLVIGLGIDNGARPRADSTWDELSLGDECYNKA
jgi:hypothetical protein